MKLAIWEENKEEGKEKKGDHRERFPRLKISRSRKKQTQYIGFLS